MDIEQTLIDFIENEIAYATHARVEPNEQLLEGVLDSTDVLRLLSFVEERFAIRVGDDELVPENFETIERLSDFIRAKRAASGGPLS
jgi:acyl carrier protein